MSWAEGRAAAMHTGATDDRREALDRVDGLLRALAQDKNLQDDLKHKDIQKALHHWTGERRLSEDEADELMEDNYRVQSVCSRMVELQSLCKQAGIGLPLPRVLAGIGLYEQLDQAGARLAQPSTAVTSPDAHAGGASATRLSGSQGETTNVERRRKAQASSKDSARGVPRTAGEGTSGGGGGENEPSWRQALIDEVLRLAGVCVCALVFTLLLKHYRGDDPLGKGLSGDQEASSGGQDEL